MRKKTILNEINDAYFVTLTFSPQDIEVTSSPDDSIGCLSFSPPTLPGNFLIAGSWANDVSAPYVHVLEVLSLCMDRVSFPFGSVLSQVNEVNEERNRLEGVTLLSVLTSFVTLIFVKKA